MFSKQTKDVKNTRNDILVFVKEQLQKAEGGEGRGLLGLELYVKCLPEEQYIFESALYHDDTNKLRNEEIQRMADDYDINMPAGWTLEVKYIQDEFPRHSIIMPGKEVALKILTAKNAVSSRPSTATIRVLHGKGVQASFEISAGKESINIGRGEMAQTADGFFRKNHVAFAEDESVTANRSVSRRHAHIEWDEKMKSFVLHADEGGIPPMNKTKVRTRGDVVIKLQTPEIGHILTNHDQVILGEEAVIEFLSGTS
ncbi:MAG: FHA domain-containing protein [Ferruginibacter sp.]